MSVLMGTVEGRGWYWFVVLNVKEGGGGHLGEWVGDGISGNEDRNGVK